MKNLAFLLSILLLSVTSLSAKEANHMLLSPDKKVEITLSLDGGIAYSLKVDGKEVISQTPIAITLAGGTVWGGEKTVRPRIARRSVNSKFSTPYYIKSEVEDCYNALRADFSHEFAIELRAYNDGVAYRFISKSAKPLKVVSERGGANFVNDCNAFVPYVRDCDGEEIIPFGAQFKTSYENLYTVGCLSQLSPRRLAFLPLAVEVDNGVKLCFADADLQAYPATYFYNPDGGRTLRALYAPYPKRTHDGGHDNLQRVVDEYDDFIAELAPLAALPWRTIMIARRDSELLANDMVMRLAEPCRIADTSWIKIGKTAWEWWNDCGVYGVGFKSGINTATYKHYVDFASEYGLEYMLLDDGWAMDKTDLMKGSNADVNLKEIVDYAATRNVGILLWTGFRPFQRDMENICRCYSAMGIKGFKVDFMDHNDQQIAEFLYKAAAVAGEHRLLLDYHGVYAPAGLNRTYPNVVNFEGVHGLEQMKWSEPSVDQITYDVTMPYIRMAAGPVDYTQGAMLNAAEGRYFPRREEPMSQGTRCRQIAEYVVFYSPLAMMADSPSHYRAEKECAEFISKVPTAWDETLALDGKIGEFINIARRNGDVWYVAALTGHKARTAELSFEFLGEGAYMLELFADGANADRYGQDYTRRTVEITRNSRLTVELAPAGGYVGKIMKK